MIVPASARRTDTQGKAFSLFEVLIVCLIIGTLAALGVTKWSRAATAASDSALSGALAILRTAIDNYARDHEGALPAPASFTAAMTSFTDASGNISAVQTSAAVFGPYLSTIPVVPVGPRKGSRGVAAADGVGVGWIFNQGAGVIAPNTTTEADATGKLYSAY